MPSIVSLLPSLTSFYPAIAFREANDFHWSPTENTVYYTTDNDTATSQLIHELSHAVLGHNEYTRDIELIRMEREAWDKAKEIAANYSITIDEETLQTHLDTYRDWLHARSTCPDCHATGYQTKKQLYHCVACSTDWRVNEARLCGLKRFKTQKHL